MNGDVVGAAGSGVIVLVVVSTPADEAEGPEVVDVFDGGGGFLGEDVGKWWV